MSEPLVLCDVRDAVAHVRLNRPDAANALDLPTAHALLSALDHAEQELSLIHI